MYKYGVMKASSGSVENSVSVMGPGMRSGREALGSFPGLKLLQGRGSFFSSLLSASFWGVNHILW